MALVLADRVQETTTSTGTGSVTLAGAVTGYQTFAAIGNGNSTFYTIADQGGSNWEVGIGTYTSSGTTLSRTTVLASSNSGSLVNFTAGTKAVFVTYPSEKSVNLDASGNVSALGTIASGTWNGSTIGVAYGGTGVTSSSGASSVVLRDASQNISFNNYVAGYAATTAAAGTTVLTVASARNQILIGSTTQTFQLPNATTLQLGQSFLFLNNSSGVLTVKDNASTTIDTVPSGAVVQIGATSIATSAGSWSAYSFLPGSYDFNSTTATFNNATISSAVWNGTTIASGYGGTGLTTFTAANNALYSTSSSALAAGTLPVAAGGTGVTTSTGTGSVVLGTNPTLVVTDTAFTLQDDVDPTKQAQFQLSGITTGTTRTYTLPNNSSTLVDLATAQTITAVKTFSAATQSIGSSTATGTQQFAYGATISGATKTVNIGTGGVSGSTTNITIGSANGTTTTIYGTSFAAADDAYFLSFMMG